jgi:hypothetical protein
MQQSTSSKDEVLFCCRSAARGTYSRGVNNSRGDFVQNFCKNILTEKGG